MTPKGVGLGTATQAETYPVPTTKRKSMGVVNARERRQAGISRGGGDQSPFAQPFSASAVAARMALRMQVPRPVFIGEEGSWHQRGGPCHCQSAVWDAQADLRATDSDTESPRPAWLSFAEMQVGNMFYAEARAIAQQETAAAAALSPKQALAKHSAVVATAFAENEAAAAALARIKLDNGPRRLCCDPRKPTRRTSPRYRHARQCWRACSAW
ncbi:hypothetical protein FIBSPDRAFT_893451 [Athelia psychrophila]|uniref:Uncharacterized protein n=1 Tax=Athelia psychrophila TaxID=1759441 RepID=A0A166H409_9AGAM|nr:hypothetical protein FIBSPDRAFT_893451 [Fibularhizoctonia sp. CBS 109695]